jgi:SAM-dependent methyltransferase
LDEYVGVDFSPALLRFAREQLTGDFFERDLAENGALANLGQFDLVVSLAVLQHIPGRLQRVCLLREMGEHVARGGRIFVSTWQFLESARQQRKVVDWSAADIDPAAVEENDFLLTWRSGAFALRYVAYIDQFEMAGLAQEAGLAIRQQFRSDGKEGNLNLYAVLERD